ncbi:MAG TPA: HAD-IG family 5'-nucleotidase [Polyangiaceae bacterium]|nr:HAD-IG family 5'-nucleotidase [Polyangiaceae bacterium]
MGDLRPIRQLVLPMPMGDEPTVTATKIGRHDRVWVSRNLKMTSVQWVGFDMDYTLAIYDQSRMDSLQVDVTVERLVKRGYPGYLSHLEYDYRFPIRGLLVDKRYGHVLKMNRFKVVRKGWHGLKPLPKDVLKELYTHRRIRPQTSRYHWIDTLFSLSEVTAYAAIVEALEKRGEKVDYGQLFRDVRECIDEAHRDGTIYATVLPDPGKYIVRDPYLAETLHKLRSAGKKLFLLTNSPWSYTDSVMRFLLGGAMNEYPSWRHYFDVAIVAAGKPGWFKEGRPLMEREGSILRDLRGPLERGKIYEGGNLRELERHLGVPGSGILYVGDHIYGDMLRSKKESAWRTAMIIQELDAELDAHDRSSADLAAQRKLEELRDNLEDELRHYQARFKELEKGGALEGAEERKRAKRRIERIRGELRHIKTEYNRLRENVDRSFHPYWGSLLKQDAELSSFGQQVDTYADVYMRRVSCLRHYSPMQFFRSPYDLMPHEL